MKVDFGKYMIPYLMLWILKNGQEGYTGQPGRLRQTFCIAQGGEQVYMGHHTIIPCPMGQLILRNPDNQGHTDAAVKQGAFGKRIGQPMIGSGNDNGIFI